jgi:hypothetical protein
MIATSATSQNWKKKPCVAEALREKMKDRMKLSFPPKLRVFRV